jgi:hypothetical protein
MTTFKMQYVLVSHESHPFLAIIRSEDGAYIGGEVYYRDERQMICHARGFLHGVEFATGRLPQVDMPIERVDALPNEWERRKAAFGR